MQSERRYLRFPRAYRFEHWLLVLTFTTLAVTGLAQKLGPSGVSSLLVGIFGGIENVRVIHRIAATILMLETIYHVGLIGYNLIVRRYKPDLMLNPTDVRNFFGIFGYNLGRRKQKPRQGRYTVEEKFEYLALVWGTIVMIVTGFVLWNPIAVTSLLPGEFVLAAKSVHGGEALLAVLAIIVWHMYHVHIRHFNRSMFTGKLSEAEMLDEHPLELEAREAAYEVKPDRWLGWRRRVYLTVYGVVALFAVLGVLVFVTFERTAIETRPPLEQVRAFVPPPQAATPDRASFDSPMTSWDDGVRELFATKCAFCHGGTTPLGGLDLSNYSKALLGGKSMPAITPRDPGNSSVIVHLNETQHPVELTGDELLKLTLWIQNGAPEH